MVAPAEYRNGHLYLTGPKRPYNPNTLQGAAPRSVGFDAMDVDLFGNDAFGHKYGVDGNIVAYQDNVLAASWVNDLFVRPASWGRVSYDWGAWFIWNPNGTESASGSANMVLWMLIGSHYGYDGFPFYSAGGWALFFENFNAGFYSIGVGGLPLSMPWTDYTGPACLLSMLSGYNSEAILPTPGAAQFTQFQMLSPTEPDGPFVGSNESDSTASAWLDLDNDLGWNGSEVFDFHSPYPIGRTQPMTCLLTNNSDPVFEGRLVFDGVSEDTLRPITEIRVQTRRTGESPFYGNPLVREEFIYLGPHGEFRATAPQDPGDYDISFVTDHFLRRTVGPFTVTGPGTIAVGTITLQNGNADHFEDTVSPSTDVSIGDYAVLSSNFFGDPYSSYDAMMCDLNRDDFIDIGDYAILSQNFLMFGDD